MGYYIEVPTNHNKAQMIAEMHGGEIIGRPASFDEIPADKGLVCVVNNGMFEAAGYCYGPREFDAFAHNDGRSKLWLLLDKKKAEQLSGFKA